MSEISYESIAPIISNQAQDGHTLAVSFTCPVSQQVVESSGVLREGQGVGATARKSAVRNALWSVGRSVRRSLGHGFAGRVAGDVADNATRSTGEKLKFGAKEKQAAAIEAFERVADQFTWDPDTSRWVHTSAIAAES